MINLQFSHRVCGNDCLESYDDETILENCEFDDFQISVTSRSWLKLLTSVVGNGIEG